MSIHIYFKPGQKSWETKNDGENDEENPMRKLRLCENNKIY